MEKHPHACGEDVALPLPHLVVSETPPRVWGRRKNNFRTYTPGGNTPTRVGKTFQILKKKTRGKKHPHACGEDPVNKRQTGRMGETPPRVWGRLVVVVFANCLTRNTPTRVGKTLRLLLCVVQHQKHPHACGEDVALPLPHLVVSETPPRVWGRPEREEAIRTMPGNTPTRVGKTTGYRGSGDRREKHPHACGEDKKS